MIHGVILRNPYKSLEGRGGQRLGNLSISRATNRAVFLLPFYSKKHFLNILMSTTQMTFHFPCTITPPHNKSGSFSTKMRLAEEHWMGDPWGDPLKSLQILRGERGQRPRNLEMSRAPRRVVFLLSLYSKSKFLRS